MQRITNLASAEIWQYISSRLENSRTKNSSGLATPMSRLRSTRAVLTNSRQIQSQRISTPILTSNLSHCCFPSISKKQTFQTYSFTFMFMTPTLLRMNRWGRLLSTCLIYSISRNKRLLGSTNIMNFLTSKEVLGS